MVWKINPDSRLKPGEATVPDLAGVIEQHGVNGSQRSIAVNPLILSRVLRAFARSDTHRANATIASVYIGIAENALTPLLVGSVQGTGEGIGVVMPVRADAPDWRAMTKAPKPATRKRKP
jgi:hypothetical protein